MWNLLFGDEEEDEATEAPHENVSIDPPMAASSTLPNSTLTASSNVIQEPQNSHVREDGIKTNDDPKLIKHRLPSPVRQAGDGMEASDRLARADQNRARKQEAGNKHGEGSIRLPLTNIRLDKLPPITDSKVRLPEASPSSPLVQIIMSQPQRSGSAGYSHIHKTKDPKFVPYEPYKAAITPLIVHKSRKSDSNIVSLPRGRFQSEAETSKIEVGSPEMVTTSSSRALPQGDPFEEHSSEPHSGNLSIHLEEKKCGLMPDDAKKLLEEKDLQLAELKKSLAEAEKQLRIQTQVNSEVKKLLVASVGEDIEAKVDYLTQDKARLAADIRQFSHQISKDFEEKEKLSVMSDLWKSKFLACSVIVDDLARWKGTLLQQRAETDHFVRLLFHERNVLWTSLMEINNVMESLRNAFDPLGVLSTPGEGNGERKISPKTAEVASVIGMADSNLTLAMELRDRLLGQSRLKPSSSPKSTIRIIDTPAEEGLRETLVSSMEAPTGYSDLASVAVTGAAKPHLMKLNDKLSAPTTSFKCCTHCQGSVQIV